YDDATTNPDDKGIWILHQRGVYNNTARLRSRPSDGFWTWDNPSYSTQCLSQSLPVFAKSSVNRITGLSYRDQLPITAPPYFDWMHVFKDVNNILHCGGFFRGDEFYGAFNTTFSSIYSRWSSPATGTWTNQLDTSFAMEAKTQLGSTITVRFYDTPIDAPPSKPQNMKFTYHSIGGGSSYPKLTWTANVEPDVNPGGYYMIERRLRELPGNWTSWTEIASVPGSTTEFIDDGITLGPTRGSDSLQYRMRAKDTQLRLSTYTEVPPIRCDLTINPPHKPFVGNVLPAQFELEQSYPNPFNPSTQFRFDIPEESEVSLAIYDILGRKVADLVNGRHEAGTYSVTWNSSGASSGVYLARFIARDAVGALKHSSTRKLVLSK
ncbi:MAG TPA: T9SS type A sorting domain-containing protein, partial [Bacteroidota bacterium]